MGGGNVLISTTFLAPSSFLFLYPILRIRQKVHIFAEHQSGLGTLLINLVGADVDKINCILADKNKHNPILTHHSESPVSFVFSVELMGIQARIERIFPENFFFF